MNIDDRLRHAFSDLEQRVDGDLASRRVTSLRQVHKVPGVLIPVFAVVAVVVALGVAAWIGRGQPEVEPVVSQPSTTVASTSTSVGEIELLPSGTVAVIAASDGAWAYRHDGTIERVLGGPVAAADGVGDGRLVYQREEGGDIYLGGPDEETTLVAVNGSALRLYGVYPRVAGELWVAYTASEGTEENRTDTLHFVAIDTPDNDVAFGEVGRFETSLASVSTDADLVLIQTTGEGFVETSGQVAGREVALPTLPTPRCDVFSEPCHVGTVVTADALRYVSILRDDVSSSLVVTSISTGLEEQSVPLPVMDPMAEIDVAWPVVVVSPRVGAEYRPPLLVDFSEDEPAPIELPIAGRGSAMLESVGPPSDASQSPADAARDGIVPELASLPLDVRVQRIAPNGGEVMAVTDEGTWVLSRPSDRADAVANGCTLGDPDGSYGVDRICPIEYGEVLLMGSDLSQIERAYPLPSYPAQWLFVTDDAIYCGRQGDGALPNSMLCRIDRQTGEFTVRVFVWGAGGEDYQALDLDAMPGTWIADQTKQTIFGSMRLGGDDLLVGDRATDTWVIIDPQTLEVIEYPAPGTSGDPATAGTRKW